MTAQFLPSEAKTKRAAVFIEVDYIWMQLLGNHRSIKLILMKGKEDAPDVPGALRRPSPESSSQEGWRHHLQKIIDSDPERTQSDLDNAKGNRAWWDGIWTGKNRKPFARARDLAIHMIVEDLIERDLVGVLVEAGRHIELDPSGFRAKDLFNKLYLHFCRILQGDHSHTFSYRLCQDGQVLRSEHGSVGRSLNRIKSCLPVPPFPKVLLIQDENRVRKFFRTPNGCFRKLPAFYHWRQLGEALHVVDFIYLIGLRRLGELGCPTQALITPKSGESVPQRTRFVLEKMFQTNATTQTPASISYSEAMSMHREKREYFVADQMANNPKIKEAIKDYSDRMQNWSKYIAYQLHRKEASGFIVLLWKEANVPFDVVEHFGPLRVTLQANTISLNGIRAKLPGNDDPDEKFSWDHNVVIDPPHHCQLLSWAKRETTPRLAVRQLVSFLRGCINSETLGSAPAMLQDQISGMAGDRHDCANQLCAVLHAINQEYF